jgi:hypothetical protein
MSRSRQSALGIGSGIRVIRWGSGYCVQYVTREYFFSKSDKIAARLGLGSHRDWIRDSSYKVGKRLLCLVTLE